MSLRIETCPADQLTPDQVTHWLQLQIANPDYRSAYFHPAYSHDAALAYGNVEVAILEKDSKPVGYFPFQRQAGNMGIPVGGFLSDYQGVIAQPDLSFDAVQLVRGCRLSGFRFTQLLASQTAFQPYSWRVEDSPSLDLSEGFDAYCKARRAAGGTFVLRIVDKLKKAVKAIGPLRFETNVDDPSAFQTLVEWKSNQYRRIQSTNHLTTPGTLDFLQRLLARRDDEFRGMLSTVHLGDHLVAVHLGMRCRKTLHYWFPTYNEDFGKHSPGLICMLEHARACSALGLNRIDLGTGNENFKASMRSFGVPVAEGAVGLGLVATSLSRAWISTRRWVESSRFHGPARNWYRRMRKLLTFGSRNEIDSRSN